MNNNHKTFLKMVFILKPIVLKGKSKNLSSENYFEIFY